MIENLYDKAPCGYFSFKDDGSILLVNATLASTLKYKKDELTGKNVEKIFTIPTRIFFQTHFFPLVKMHHHAEELFLTLLTKDQQHLPVLLNAQRMEFENEMLTSCAFIVVQHRKKFEDELVAARKAAENALQENTALIKAKSDLQNQTEKLDDQIRLVTRQNHELRQFSHVVTHSLKEPLRKMLLYTEKLHSKPELSGVEKLANSTEQMKGIISGLQQYVWLNDKETKFTKVDLNIIVQKAADQLKQELNSDLFTLHAHQMFSLEGDPKQLQLLVYHLLSNAVKFKKNEKATVHIYATVIKQNKFRSVEDKYKYEDFIRLEVVDDGIGFEIIYKDQIFDLFKKLHLVNGHGLGLALCKKIVDNHNGSIDAESEPGVGTKIIVWLPLQQRDVPEIDLSGVHVDL